MNKLSNYAPFFMLIFLVSIIGLSTYKINAKQQIKLEDLPRDPGATASYSAETRFFSKVNILLPEFSLPDLDNEGGVFSNKDLMGQYSVINLFASWCTTCRAEHDVLMRLKYDGIIDIYGVAWRDINANTRKYLQEEGNPFKKVATDNKALFTKMIGIKAVPETLVVNPEGRVILRYQGNLEDFAADEIRKFIANNIAK